MRRRQSTDAWQPALCFGVLAVAQLAVFWFEAYRLLSLAFLLVTATLFLVSPRPGLTIQAARPVAIAFTSVYIYMLFAVGWAPRPSDAGFEYLLGLAVSIPPFVFGYTLARRYSLPSIGLGIALLPISFAIQALFNLYAYDDAMRLGEFNLRTHAAGLICISAPIMLARYLSFRRSIDLVFCLIAVVLALVIQSRSSLIIVLPALLFVFRHYNKKVFQAGLVLSGLAAVAVIGFILSGGSIGRLSSDATSLELSSIVLDEFANRDEEGVDLERRVQAFFATSLFLTNPVFGGGYASVLQTFVDEFDVWINAHGFVPGMLGELGIVGISIIALFLWKTFELLEKLKVAMPHEFSLVIWGYKVSFGAIIAYGFFHQTFEWAYFPMLVGIFLGASRIPRSRNLTSTVP